MRNCRYATLVLIFAACTGLSYSAHAQQTNNFPFSGLTLELREYVNPPASALISMTTRPDASQLHVSAQSGEVFAIMEDAMGQTTPSKFFDYNDEINEEFGFGSGLNLGSPSNAHGGLRAVAFHPEFATNGKMYTAAMVQQDSSATNFLGNDSFAGGIPVDSLVAEWTFNPATNDFSDYRELFRVTSPVFDHTLKQMKFNPLASPGDEDYGLLYIAHGDGGDQRGTWNGGQNGDDARGKILRINPLEGPSGESYTVVNSPFADNASVLDEVYSMGHRNPHNISFALDALGDSVMLNGDIGRDEREEINHILPGANYGWSQREGTLVHNPDDPTGPLPPNEAQNGYTFPVAQYDHTVGFGGIAIAMGHVIQNGSDPALQGQLIFGDFATGGEVYHAALDDILNAVIQLDPDDPTRDEPSDLTQAPIFRARLALDHDNDPTTPAQMYTNFNTMLGTNRNDMRFGRGTNGELYISTKQTGGRVFLVTNSLGAVGGLKLTVDRDTNEVVIVNSSGEGDIDVNEYTLISASGSLDPSGWQSLQDQGLPGWQEQSSFTQQLSESNASNSSTIGDASPIALGAAYQPGDAPFGEAPPSDIQFTYSTPDGGSLVGVVEYLGEGIANNLVLNIDPATGAAQLLNESIHTIDFDGFAITSEAGSLDGEWTRDESELSEDWVLSNPSDENIALLNPDFADTLQGGEIINLGTLFSGDASQQSQDLMLEFVLAEENFERFGVVRYNGIIQHSGDFNADGAVDGADFVLWQQQFGQEGQLEADGNGDGRVNEVDLAIWENQYGIVSQTSQPTSEVVPEPSALLLALVCVAAAKLRCATFRDGLAAS